MHTRRDTLCGLASVPLLGLSGCSTRDLPDTIEIHDPDARALFRGSPGLSQLADRFVWSEGPTWDRERGCLYFTDPPYGLEGLNASPLKEMSANGVYRLGRDGQCTRLYDQLSFPNGIALSPDERWLYVSQSDPAAPYIYRAELYADGGVGPLERWFDTSVFLAAGDPGLPDGLCVSTDGIVFATGPGGVFVLAPDGHLMARILTGRATANCAFGGEDGRTLFMTAHDRLLRLPTRVAGVQWRTLSPPG
ncbi:SMP-30/gluconolactonase/LRE family protein [Maricaulaceae bacterium NA33B04]|nr:SMP-30/gluconolactonase/LRE family protein [Maricaulaceae bacterium NA33B04]